LSNLFKIVYPAFDQARRDFIVRDIPSILFSARAIPSLGLNELSKSFGEEVALATDYKIETYLPGDKKLPKEALDTISICQTNYPELKLAPWKTYSKITAPSDKTGFGAMINVINFDNGLNVDANAVAKAHTSLKSFASKPKRLPYINKTSMTVSEVFSPQDLVLIIVPNSVAKNRTHSMTLTGRSNAYSYIRVNSEQELLASKGEKYANALDLTATTLVNEMVFNTTNVFPFSINKLSRKELNNMTWLYWDIFANSFSRAWNRRKNGSTWDEYSKELNQLTFSSEGKNYPIIIFDRATFASINSDSKPILY
jgi:hypothetical protein